MHGLVSCLPWRLQASQICTDMCRGQERSNYEATAAQVTGCFLREHHASPSLSYCDMNRYKFGSRQEIRPSSQTTWNILIINKRGRQTARGGWKEGRRERHVLYPKKRNAAAFLNQQINLFKNNGSFIYRVGALEGAAEVNNLFI